MRPNGSGKMCALLARVGPRGGFGSGLFGRRGDAEAHEEETEAFAEGLDEAHGQDLSREAYAIDLLRLVEARGGGWGPRQGVRVHG
jgi:hypothetical protein